MEYVGLIYKHLLAIFGDLPSNIFIYLFNMAQLKTTLLKSVISYFNWYIMSPKRKKNPRKGEK